jgi:hypothetical protein
MIFSTVKALLRYTPNINRDFAEVERILRANTHEMLIVEDHKNAKLIDDIYSINVKEGALVHTRKGAAFEKPKIVDNADVWMQTKVISIETGAALCISMDEEGKLEYSERILNPHEKTKSRKIYSKLISQSRNIKPKRVPAAKFLF